MTDYGKPAAKKVRDCGWWLPAVTTMHGPKALPDGDRHDTPGKAKAAARAILASVALSRNQNEGQ